MHINPNDFASFLLSTTYNQQSAKWRLRNGNRNLVARRVDHGRRAGADFLGGAAQMIDFVVVNSHPSMISYIDALQKKNAESLSFYPRQVFEREEEKGRLFLGLLNGQPCGYLYTGAQGRDVKLHQVCIEYDARRRLYGAGIVAVMEAYANEGKATSVTLRCGFDIDANHFWRELGYQCIAHHIGGIRRMRTINVWRKWLGPELFETLAIEPAQGIQDASIWRKNKQTGIVSQFVRGKRMMDYRAMVIAK